MAARTKPELLSVEKINERYTGEWVLLEVTEDDKGWPSRGYVHYHGKSRGKKWLQVVKDLHERNPQVRMATIMASTRGVSGEDFSRAIDEAAQRPYVNARW